MRQHLHLAGRHVRIDRTLGAVAYLALHPQYVLTADAFGFRKNLRSIGIENDLQQALPVPEINKDHAAVIAPPVHPAADRDLLADLLFVDLSAIVGAHL